MGAGRRAEPETRLGQDSARRADLRLRKHFVLCQGDRWCCDHPFCPFVSPASTSTVADAYRWLNHTVGNRTVVEDGYYYLNNFDNILNSFGECRNLSGTFLGLCHCRSQAGEQSCLLPLPPGCLPRPLECSLAQRELVGCMVSGAQARPGPGLTQTPEFLLFWYSFGVREQKSFMLCWEALSPMLGTQPCEPATVPLHCSDEAHTALPLGPVRE